MRKSLILLFSLFFVSCCAWAEASESFRAIPKTAYPVEDAVLTGVHPNVLFLLDTGSSMVFTPVGIMPDTGDGRTQELKRQLVNTGATYGGGARPYSLNGVENTGAAASRYGRDMDRDNNIIGDLNSYYSPDPNRPYFLTFKNRAWADWNGLGDPPADMPADLATYLPGGANAGHPVPAGYTNLLVPNDSRMYQMKLALWRILGQANAETFSGMRVGMAMSYREGSYPYMGWSADFYFNAAGDGTWPINGPSWLGIIDLNTSGNTAFAGVDRLFYNQPQNNSAWAQVNRAYLTAPFDYIYKQKADEDGAVSYAPTQNLDRVREFLDGIEDGSGATLAGSVLVNDELFADGKTPLATSIYSRHIMGGRVDNNNVPIIRYGANLVGNGYGTGQLTYGNAWVRLHNFPISEDLRPGSPTIRAGQALGSVIDFFSPPSTLPFNASAHADNTANTLGYFPILGSCQSNWLVVFTAANDSDSGYTAAEAATMLFEESKAGMRGRYWNGEEWVEDANLEMDSGIRTLVVGMVDPDTLDDQVVNLRQSLNDLAQAGDPILSSDIGGNEVYVPNPDAKAYFATNVTELMASLNSILTRINAGKFAAGAPVVLPLYSDGTNQKVLFSASYKINTMDQWDAWLSKYVMSGDFEANEAWEFNGGKLVPTRTTRRVYTIPTSKGEGGTTSQLVNALTAAEVEALTGVPQAKATEFTTWLRQYNQFQILGDMENSGMQIVDYDDADAKTIYLQTNRGVLHALDFASGDETWGFFPPNVFQTRLKSLKYSAEGDWYDGDGVNTVRSVAYDLLDGPLTYKNVSVNSMASDYKTILFGNLGRGGNGIYAMDITQPFTTPRFLWAVDNDRYDGGPSKEVALWGNSVSASNTSLYEKLGMTIAPGLFLSADVSDLDKRNILFLPGGLGYKLGEDDQGKIFYAIAPYDGSVLRAFTEDSGFAGANGAHLGMGIAPVTAHFDENTKTIHDFFVVPDSEGNVLFCDATLPLNFWSLKSIFQLTNSADIPVSIPKTLGLVKTQNKQLWVYGGSAPLDGPDKDEEGYNRGIVNEQNYIFGFNLTKASGDVGLTTADIDMKELKYIRDTTPLLPIFGQPWVSGDNQLDPSLIKGWYLGLRPRQPMDDMGTEPEYVTTSPYFYSNTLYVSTFIPRVKMPNEYDICPDLGHSKIYALDPLTGEGQWKDENGDKGIQSVLIKDVKITGITSLNGRIYVGVKPLKPSALEELPAQVSESKFLFPGGTMWSFGALNYEGEARPPSLDPDVPYIQYWKDIVNP